MAINWKRVKEARAYAKAVDEAREANSRLIAFLTDHLLPLADEQKPELEELNEATLEAEAKIPSPPQSADEIVANIYDILNRYFEWGNGHDNPEFDEGFDAASCIDEIANAIGYDH